METKPFSELAPGMKTGDLVLFSGRYEESELIEKLEHSPWSHVGMVVRLPDDEQPLFWESTTLMNLADEIFHDHLQGPKVVNLYQRMKQYGRDLKPYMPKDFTSTGHLPLQMGLLEPEVLIEL